jgi:hypothetical protein
VIAPVPVVSAIVALFLDVNDLAVGGNLPVLAGDAPAGQRREAEKANKTHHGDPSERRIAEQLLYRSAEVIGLLNSGLNLDTRPSRCVNATPSVESVTQTVGSIAA